MATSTLPGPYQRPQTSFGPEQTSLGPGHYLVSWARASTKAPTLDVGDDAAPLSLAGVAALHQGAEKTAEGRSGACAQGSRGKLETGRRRDQVAAPRRQPGHGSGCRFGAAAADGAAGGGVAVRAGPGGRGGQGWG